MRDWLRRSRAAAINSVLTSGELGQHNGLPCTIIVSTTLKELESGCGQAVTAGGTLLPMTDVIRMASHSYHYLVIFDRHTEIPLYLGRSKRIASPGQRIVTWSRSSTVFGKLPPAICARADVPALMFSYA